MAIFPNLIKFFSSYGSYHNNIVNKLIHIICIPTIVFSLLAMLQHATFHLNLFSNSKVFEINVQLISVLLVTFVYMIIDLPSGFVSHLIYTSFCFINNHLYYKAVQNNSTSEHFKIFLIIHIIAWILQFIGHGVFEKRAPALFDNLLQTLVAPDFVVLEILFHFGYKHDDYIKIKKEIHKNIAEFRESKTKTKQK